MVITKELLIARANELRKQAEKLQSDLNATLGAMQDCNFWLAQLDKPEEAKVALLVAEDATATAVKNVTRSHN